MCGIIGMVANRDVVSVLTDGLRRMEYRGYDSAGIAVYNDTENGFIRRRAKGKMSALNDEIANNAISGTIGIGHIRWATHGEPTVANAHPHQTHNVTVVHNGIVENWKEIKTLLTGKGYQFSSQTDTEVVAQLVQYYLDDGMPTFEAFKKAVKELEGAYALAVMIDTAPHQLFVARLGSPLLVGEGDDANYVGSDALALAPSTDKVRYLEEGDYGIVTVDNIVIYDANDNEVSRDLVETGLSADDTDKGGYPHFMLKEINEQPEILENLIHCYIDSETKTIKPLDVTFDANDTGLKLWHVFLLISMLLQNIAIVI